MDSRTMFGQYYTPSSIIKAVAKLAKELKPQRIHLTVVEKTLFGIPY